MPETSTAKRGRASATKRARRTTVLLGLSIVVTAPELPGQDPPLWTRAVDQDIVFYRVGPMGNLLVGTTNTLQALDAQTGRSLWIREGFAELTAADLTLVPGMRLALLRTADGMSWLDPSSGATRWNGTDRLLETRWRAYVPHGLALLFGPSSTTLSSLLGVDLETGRVKWRQDNLLGVSVTGPGHQPPLVDTDSSVILHVDAGGPLKIHTGTGRLMWRADPPWRTPPPTLTDGYARILHDRDRGVAYVPNENGLLAIDASDGTLLWSYHAGLGGRVSQTELTTGGLLIRAGILRSETAVEPTEFLLDLLDPQTGTSLWSQPFREVDTDAPFAVRRNTVYTTTKREFIAIALADGTARHLARIEFRDGEHAALVERIGENFLFSSRQNFLLLDTAGTIRYERYYRAPRVRSSLHAALTIGLGTILDVTICVLSDLEEDPEACDRGPWGENPRFKAGMDAANYAYIYTDTQDGGREPFRLVKLEKATGREVARVWIDDRNPEFVLDPIAGIVFVKRSDRELAALRFVPQ